jgi:hypothetical protein
LIVAAMLLASLSSTAAAAQPSDPFEACARETDSTARLACFDRAIAARRATPAAPAPAAASRPAPAPAAPATGTSAGTAAAAATTAAATTAAATSAAATGSALGDAGLTAREQHRARRERGEPEPPPPAPIVAKVVRVIPREPLISAFELDNGQIWEQSETTNFPAKPQEEITIRPGVLGAFFLKSASGAVVRAHRLK